MLWAVFNGQIASPQVQFRTASYDRREPATAVIKSGCVRLQNAKMLKDREFRYCLAAGRRAVTHATDFAARRELAPARFLLSTSSVG